MGACRRKRYSVYRKQLVAKGLFLYNKRSFRRKYGSSGYLFLRGWYDRHDKCYGELEDIPGDVINTTWQITKTYAAGTYVVNALNSNARVCPDRTTSPTCNGALFNLQSVVTVPGTNNPPVSSFPTVINIPINSPAAVFNLTASDPDLDSIAFRFSRTGAPAAVTNSTDVLHESGLTTQVPPGLTLSPDGTITMNTIGRSIDSQFSFQLMIEDFDRVTKLPKSKTPVDFLIRMVAPSSPPFFTAPTITSYIIPIGTLQNFTVTANTSDPARTVTLMPVSVPFGVTMSPALPVSGSVGGPVSSVFSWTPGTNQTGTYVITYVAQNELGLQTFKSVTLTVPCALSASTSITPSTCASLNNGAVTVSPANFSAAGNLSYSGWARSFSATTKDLSGLAAGAYNLRIDDIGTSCFTNIPVAINNTLTITPSASSNSPICEGGTLTLAGSGASNLSWSGPNSFSATGATPSIPNVSTAASGTYTLTATDGATGCSATTTTSVLVNPHPATPIITASGPTTFCQGGTVTLRSQHRQTQYPP